MIGAGPRLGLGDALRTASPINDLGLVDLVVRVVGRRQTRDGADRAIDVDHTAAGATDQMVVVVADAILEARGRPRGLNAPDQAFRDQNPEGVVHRLQRDGADLTADGLGESIGRRVGLIRYCAQDSQSLRGDLNPAVPKQVCRVGCHAK
jgi:hypothetical protein